MKIKSIKKDNKIAEAMQLVWQVFLEFEAPDYSEAGIKTFQTFINNYDSVRELDIYAAYENDRLLGVIAVRFQSHISLFFVPKEFQKQGIGRRLFEYVLNLCHEKKMTVNSSPYAVLVYRRLGFVDTDTEALEDGIRYTPMEYQKDLSPFLEENEYMDFTSDIIAKRAATLFQNCTNDIEKAKTAFEFVRDEIPHSFDISAKVITAKASDVLKHRTGICHAKANLLAALLRSQGIPAGMCFQHITLADDESKGYCVHCYNGIYVDRHWIKVDARGNTNGKNAQFSLGEPILAFPIRKEYDEYYWKGIYAKPHTATMRMLEQAACIQDIIDNIPDNIDEII